jgi:hypothetical protein
VTVSKFLQSVLSILETPRHCPCSSKTCKFANRAVGELFESNKEQFEETARTWTRLHATPQPSSDSMPAGVDGDRDRN